MSYQFSNRTNWDLGENAFTEELKVQRDRGQEIIDLTVSNPTKCGFDYPKDIFLPPLATKASLTYEPESRGLLKARQAVVDYYVQRNVSIVLAQCVLTASTSEGYSFLFRLLMNPGDEVLMPSPSYPLFSYLAGLNDVEVSRYYLKLFDGEWRLDFSSLEKVISQRTKAIVLVSPNNPTGSFIKREELSRLNDFCRAHSLVIICDEVFTDYIFPEHRKDYVSLVQNKDVPTFVLGGLSKALGLPQMKLGWIISNGPDDYVTQAMARLDVIADTHLSVNAPVQHAVVEWLPQAVIIQDQINERIQNNYQVLKEIFSESCLLVEGGWYGLLCLHDSLDEEMFILELLKEYHLSVHPGYFFDFSESGFLVISLLPAEDLFRQGVKLLKKALECRS